MLINFHNSFTNRLTSKFLTKLYKNVPQHPNVLLQYLVKN